MKLFTETLNEIKKNKENVKKGLVNCISFDWMPKLKKIVPGIVKGVYYIVTANSGIK